MLIAYIIISIVSAAVMIFVMRHPQPPLVPGPQPKIERRIHRPHLPHIRRPHKYDN